MELARILGDIHGILGLIVLTGITLLFLNPDIFSSRNDESKPK